MRKVIITLLIFASCFCYGARINVEKVAETTLLVVRIDSNQFHSKGNQVSYQTVIEVFNSEGKAVWLEKKDINISAESLSKNILVLLIETNLPQGNYTLYLKLNNKLRNDRQEEKFEIQVDNNLEKSHLYNLQIKGENLFELSSLDLLSTSEIYLFQLYEKDVSQLKLVSESDSTRQVTSFTGSKRLAEIVDKTNFVPDFTHNYLEYILDNVLYQHQLTFEKKLNSFQEKYSWEDQLKQLKYIVNENTWKQINRNKHLSAEQRVLKFWTDSNPQGSDHNEFQEVFYKRIIYADEKYSVHRYKKGWQTDRGRIFIKFGRADEIRVDNHPIDKYPTETWYYYQLNKTFLFYDRSRIEDYKLYNKEEEYDF